MPSLAVSIQATGVLVTPGSSASFTVEVRNLSTVVDRYRCEIVGMDPSWVTVTPASLELFPTVDEAHRRPDSPPSVGRFTITLHPPRASTATAGPWPIGAKVTSEHDALDRIVEETTVAVLPFGALEADLHPSITGGRLGARAIVQVTNDGNRPEVVSISGSDPAAKIDFEFRPPEANLAPGESIGIGARLAAGGLKLVGSTESRPFKIGIRTASPDTPAHTLTGTFERRALVPTALPIALGGLIALALGAIAVFGLTRPPAPSPSPAAPSLAVVSPSPATPAPTATPAPSPTDTPAPTDTPEPTSPPPIETSTLVPGTCIQGYVWREAWDGDIVCVTPDQRQRVADDNAAAASRVDPAGAYGPNTCIQGYVWRVARPEDLVCVTPDERQQVADDNAAAASRVQP